MTWLLALACAAVPTVDGGSAALSGTVRTSDGKPVAQAQVGVEGDSASTLSRADGTFTLERTLREDEGGAFGSKDTRVIATKGKLLGATLFTRVRPEVIVVLEPRRIAVEAARGAPLRFESERLGHKASARPDAEGRAEVELYPTDYRVEWDGDFDFAALVDLSLGRRRLLLGAHEGTHMLVLTADVHTVVVVVPGRRTEADCLKVIGATTVQGGVPGVDLAWASRWPRRGRELRLEGLEPGKYSVLSSEASNLTRCRLVEVTVPAKGRVSLDP